jgi:hypothetical protein
MRRLLTLLLLLASAAAWAQKAKPLEIPLHDGEGVVHGRLKSRQQTDYEFTADGQTLSIALTAAPIRTLSIRVYDPDGALMTLQKDGVGRWTTALSKRGDYGVTVLRTNASAPVSTFKMRVTIH